MTDDIDGSKGGVDFDSPGGGGGGGGPRRMGEKTKN